MIPIDATVSVLMPANNEGNHIYENVKETERVLEEAGINYEIIVIDDGSTDNTLQEIQRAALGNGAIKVCQCQDQRGKGRALREGFLRSSGDFVVFLDSDLDLHPGQIGGFLDRMHQEGTDVVIGSKRHPESKLDYPFHRKVVSTVYFFVVKLLFGLPIKDTQTGLKLFKRGVLEKVFPKLLVKEFAYDLELLVLAHRYGFKISMAPVVINFHARLRRFISTRTIYRTWLDTMAVFYRAHILKYYDKV